MPFSFSYTISRQHFFSHKQGRNHGFKVGGSERRRREQRRVEAPKGVDVGEGVSPSPLAEGSGEGAVPPPQKFFI